MCTDAHATQLMLLRHCRRRGGGEKEPHENSSTLHCKLANWHLLTLARQSDDFAEHEDELVPLPLIMMVMVVIVMVEK